MNKLKSFLAIDLPANYNQIKEKKQTSQRKIKLSHSSRMKKILLAVTGQPEVTTPSEQQTAPNSVHYETFGTFAGQGRVKVPFF